MFSLASFYKAYETTSHELVISGRKFKVLLPKDLTGLIDPQDVFHEFPLWAKIWPASWVLADFLAQMPADPTKSMLEIGAGAGLVSIVAASFGHNITLTETNPDALMFARANALVNGCPQLPILELDWNRPQLKQSVDYLLGSEITYKKEDWQSLINLFKNCSKPRAEIILAGEIGRTRKDIYRRLETEFNIRAQKKMLHSGDDAIAVFLLQLSRKEVLQP